MASSRYPVLIVLAAVATLVPAPARGQGALKTYQTKYYILETDVDPDRVKEITRRITLMAEEYHNRTRGFAGTVKERLPIRVFRRPEDSYAAGGVRGSAGVFMGDKLMVLAGEQITAGTWHTVQHEGFHQFALAAIGRGRPPWANEGLAEYFGEGLYTGDNFYTGLIPPGRLARLRDSLKEHKVRALLDLMRLSHESWNAEVELAHAKAGQNYDQAWSMVHFLAQADNGRYRDPFSKFLSTVSRGQPWEPAWARSFGFAVDGFQKRWEDWWLGLSEKPTDDLYAQATLATLTSFYARALSQRQSFDSYDDFVKAAQAKELKAHADDWLPPALLTEALKQAPGLGTWTLEKRGARRTLVLELPDGAVLTGDFKVIENRVKSVDVIVKPPKKKGGG